MDNAINIKNVEKELTEYKKLLDSFMKKLLNKLPEPRDISGILKNLTNSTHHCIDEMIEAQRKLSDVETNLEDLNRLIKLQMFENPRTGKKQEDYFVVIRVYTDEKRAEIEDFGLTAEQIAKYRFIPYQQGCAYFDVYITL